MTVFTLSTTAVAAEKTALNTTRRTLNVGETYRLKLTNANHTVQWKSDNKKVARVDDKGRVIYIFSIPDYLIAVTGQALDGGSIGTVDSTIKDILKNMTVL